MHRNLRAAAFLAALTLLALTPALAQSFQPKTRATISGHVYDDSGKPLADVMVQALRYGYLEGQRQLTGPESIANTGNLGKFQLDIRFLGQYLIVARYPYQEFHSYVESKTGYPPTYYPGVVESSRATPITVREGENLEGADIKLHAVHTVNLRGSIISNECAMKPETLNVMLKRLGDRAEDGASPQEGVQIDSQGGFEYIGVIPGPHQLYAYNEHYSCFTFQTLQVGDTDMEGVTLRPTPGIELRGQLRVEGELPPKPALIMIDPNPLDRSPVLRNCAEIRRDGSFLFRHVFDATYAVNISDFPPSYYLKSARLNGVDVLAKDFTIDAVHAPGKLNLVVSANGATVEGVIAKDGKPLAGSSVALVPNAPERNEMRRYKYIYTQQDGRFRFDGIAPGDYKVFAWEEAEYEAWKNKDFLELYEPQGKPVHITEGAHLENQENRGQTGRYTSFWEFS